MALAPMSSDPIVALCDSMVGAQAVVDSLVRQGVDPAQLSVMGSSRDLPGSPTLEQRLREWGGRGSLWGALGGLAIGAVLAVPPIGSVIAMGPLAILLLGTLEGAMVGGGLSTIVAMLTGLGLPSDAAQRCEDAVAAHRFVVFMHGDPQEVARARDAVAAAAFAGVHADAPARDGVR